MTLIVAQKVLLFPTYDGRVVLVFYGKREIIDISTSTQVQLLSPIFHHQTYKIKSKSSDWLVEWKLSLLLALLLLLLLLLLFYVYILYAQPPTYLSRINACRNDLAPRAHTEAVAGAVSLPCPPPPPNIETPIFLVLLLSLFSRESPKRLRETVVGHGNLITNSRKGRE